MQSFVRLIPVFVLTSLLVTACNTTDGRQTPDTREVAVTFDDAPIARFYSHKSQWDRKQLVDSLTATLNRYNVPATVFVIGSRVASPEGQELMRMWLDSGVRIGNHSMTHTSFNKLTIEQGEQEIEQAQDVLKPLAAAYGQQVRYFRYPYLAEGASAEKKAAWLQFLHQHGMADARVTISNDDWKFNEQYADAEVKEEWEHRYDVGQAYMKHIRQSIDHWEQVSRQVAGRNVKHVLLLHANRINRDYLSQILDELVKRGYRFITLDEAYTDPIFDAKDEWVSENGTSFLENIKQTQLSEEKAQGTN